MIGRLVQQGFALAAQKTQVCSSTSQLKKSIELTIWILKNNLSPLGVGVGAGVVIIGLSRIMATDSNEVKSKNKQEEMQDKIRDITPWIF